MEERPRAVLLRVPGALLLIGGVGVNVWLLAAESGFGWRVAVMLLAPGVILLFAAWLAEHALHARLSDGDGAGIGGHGGLWAAWPC